MPNTHPTTHPTIHPLFRHYTAAAALFLAAAILHSPTTSHGADTATIRGAVNFTGTPPTMPKIRISADPTCSDARKGEAPTRQDVVVNRNNTLKNVIVYIKSGLPAGKSYPMPAEAAVLDQRGCMYEPHVFAVRVGQDLKILNSDPTIHNIQSKSQVNPKFNEFMTSNKVPPKFQKFTKAEMPIPIKCDVHPWMIAYAGAFEHPYFAVTSEEGAFEFKGLAPGEYTVATWHEEYGAQEQKVTVADGEAKEASFTYKPAEGAPKAN